MSKDDTMFYLIDPKTGTVIEPGHDLEGKNTAKKILISPSGKGSSAVQADGIYQLDTERNTPKAMIIQHLETALISGVIIMEVPMVDKVDPAFYNMAKGRDIIYVDAGHSVIEILSEQSAQAEPRHRMKEEDGNEPSTVLVYR